MIKFGDIRGYASGQRASFEALVCQLARRDRQAVGAKFRRVEGSGGDGGVEAYWLLPRGAEIGYQAKFFTRSGDIDWTQIDKSVAAIVSAHPKLTKYIVAIPCDFTDRTGATGRGKTGWEHWETHRKKWQKLALKKLNRKVEFIPWTADEIQNKLTLPESAGLREYWFGATELSSDWFRRHLELAVASLEERYHPEDHVDVTIQKLFEFIARHPKSREALQDQFSSVRKSPWPTLSDQTIPVSPPPDLVSKARKGLEDISRVEGQLKSSIWEPWDSENWRQLLNEAQGHVSSLRQWMWKAKEGLPKDSAKEGKRNSFEYALHDLGKVHGALRNLESTLRSSYLDAERERAALIVGRAGSGKSHLLAHVVESALSEGRPAILLLGHQLRDDALWPQILQRLEIQGVSADALLGALDAAAEAAGTRGLILVDAINEGAGARLWKKELASFLTTVRRYPNLACVLSCRSEYVDYIVPTGARLQRYEVRGFETLKEQENAARTYLDRRGISRPATPWLAPEFVNPLFLRSCSTALQLEGKSEFPRGLMGTKAILAFYIDSVARHLGTSRDGTNDLVGPTKKALSNLALVMATNKCDYATHVGANQIADECFASFLPPPNMSWLDVLQRNGLVRLDPDPQSLPGDPLNVPGDVVRFSFQRFQDHLMGDALLTGVIDIKQALATGGALSFMLKGNSVSWEWNGLVEAFSTQIPELYKVELVDVLPGNPATWWQQWPIQHGFVESVRWRDKSSFGGRTLELLNKLDGFGEISRLRLLIELSASIEHPWNANLIHRNIRKKKMPERDVFWTSEINLATHEETHPIWRLIDWALHGQSNKATEETQKLCALVLSWCLTSSSRAVRDLSTKALTSLFLTRRSLFPWIVDSFKGVDDLYVWERIFAAAYGACCLDRATERLIEYSHVTMKTVFSEKSVPDNLRQRDYARGIVELAAIENALPKGLDIGRARPPYKSRLPKLTVSKAQLKKAAKKAGGDAILNSCTGFIGDFGSYTIDHAISRFSTVLLKKPKPYSETEIFERFQEAIAKKNSKRARAWKELRDSFYSGMRIVLHEVKTGSPEKSDKARRKNEVTAIQGAAAKFLSLLSPKERIAFWSEAASYLGFKTKKKKMGLSSQDSDLARRWVGNRAYELGWTKKRFANEADHQFGVSRDRPRVERIGKKYQWIALNELLCGFADNYWMFGEWKAGAIQYESPLDVGFFRDIDPTMLPELPETMPSSNMEWIFGAPIKLDNVDEVELFNWPFLVNRALSLSKLIYRTDTDGRRWATLYDYCSSSSKYDDGIGRTHNLRQQEFRFVLAVVIKKAHVAKFVSHLQGKKKIDVHHWDPPEFVDGPYLHEAPWRSTWQLQRWRDDGWAVPKGLPTSAPVLDYRWESHLDASLPEGASALLPAIWLMKEFGLVAERMNPGFYMDNAGKTCFVSARVSGESAAALIDADQFEKYLSKKSLACVWLFLDERNTWPGGDYSQSASRRSEGICQIRHGKPRVTTWNYDRIDRPGGLSKGGVRGR